MASIVGRPAARLGGAAGRLARDNAMRNPGRTAVTASALMIGVALVTAVTIVAQGLEDQGRGQLADTVQAQTVVTATDGWSPIDPKVEQAVAGLGRASSMRQDGAQAFGNQEAVNGFDPADPAFRFDVVDGSTELGRDGALVNDGFASDHGLRVGSTFTVTSIAGKRLKLTVRGIEKSPAFDVLGLGPITVSPAAFDATFEQRRNRMTFVDAPQDAVAKALARVPERQGRGQGRLHRRPDGLDRLDPRGPLGAAGAGRDRLPVRHRQHARALDLRAHAGARHAARAGHEPAPGAPDGPPRERDHGADRRGARDRRRARARRRRRGLARQYGLSYAVPAPSLVAVAIVAALAGMIAAALPARRAARIDVLKALAYE